jgi:hypothetical protein
MERLVWFAIAIATILWGVFVLRVWWPHLTEPGGWWAIDSRRVLEATRLWQAGGDPYSILGFLYSPVVLVVAIPFLWVGEWGWVAVEVVALSWLVLDATRSHSLPARALALVAGALYLPAAADLLLGNVTIALTAAALLALRSDRRRSGVAFGLALAAVPKPLFVPLLLWMVVHRRESLKGVVVGGLAGTTFGLIVMSPALYASFVTTLALGGRIPLDFAGNSGLSAISPLLGYLGIALGLAVTGIALARRSAGTSLVVVTLAGVFTSPYAGLYAGVPLLLALPGFARVRPIRAQIVACLSAGFVLAMPLFAMAAISAAFLRDGDRRTDA